MSIIVQVLLWTLGTIAAFLIIGYFIAMYSINSMFDNMELQMDDEPFF